MPSWHVLPYELLRCVFVKFLSCQLFSCELADALLRCEDVAIPNDEKQQVADDVVQEQKIGGCQVRAVAFVRQVIADRDQPIDCVIVCPLRPRRRVHPDPTQQRVEELHLALPLLFGFKQKHVQGDEVRESCLLRIVFEIALAEKAKRPFY